MNTTESIIRCVCARWQGETHDKVEKKNTSRTKPEENSREEEAYFFSFYSKNSERKDDSS
jgi:hypothetical protein